VNDHSEAVAPADHGIGTVVAHEALPDLRFDGLEGHLEQPSFGDLESVVREASAHAGEALDVPVLELVVPDVGEAAAASGDGTFGVARGRIGECEPPARGRTRSPQNPGPRGRHPRCRLVLRSLERDPTPAIDLDQDRRKTSVTAPEPRRR